MQVAVSDDGKWLVVFFYPFDLCSYAPRTQKTTRFEYMHVAFIADFSKRIFGAYSVLRIDKHDETRGHGLFSVDKGGRRC